MLHKDQSLEGKMCERMVWSSFKLILLVLSVKPSWCQEVINSTISEGNEDSLNEVQVFTDVAAATAFINSSEIAVIAFFEDAEAPELEHYNVLAKKHPEWDYGMSTSKRVLKHFKITSNTVSIFRKVDNNKIDLIVSETKDIDTEKLFRFLTINELRLVTEYNPMTAIGIMASKVQIHLLLFIEKEVERKEEILKEFRDAAEAFIGKVLFVTVDVRFRGNERVMFYFKLKISDLPKAVIFSSEDEQNKVLDSGDITAKRLIDFCNGFLSGEYTNEEPEEQEAKTEL